ncbi:MAG: hypothetical protein K6E40_12705 [Desulfovibrio sp.]|nr:hypothetical protein [Desulfovibrio sp.]
MKKESVAPSSLQILPALCLALLLLAGCAAGHAGAPASVPPADPGSQTFALDLLATVQCAVPLGWEVKHTKEELIIRPGGTGPVGFYGSNGIAVSVLGSDDSLETVYGRMLERARPPIHRLDAGERNGVAVLVHPDRFTTIVCEPSWLGVFVMAHFAHDADRDPVAAAEGIRAFRTLKVFFANVKIIDGAEIAPFTVRP